LNTSNNLPEVPAEALKVPAPKDEEIKLEEAPANRKKISIISSKIKTKGKLYSVERENYANYLLTRDTFGKLQYRGNLDQSTFLTSFKAYLESESVMLLAANWQKMYYGAVRAAACLHDGGPSSAVFGGDTKLFENIIGDASHYIRNCLTSVAYLPIRIFEVEILKNIRCTL
jgi:hypothetical protein